MIEPQNDEERKALRLCAVWCNNLTIEGFSNEQERDAFLRIGTEARAIVREGLGATAVVTLRDAREAELEQVRADITRTTERMSALSQALLYKYGPAMSVRPSFPPYEEELDRLVHAYCAQSARERELAKSEPEGGK